MNKNTAPTFIMAGFCVFCMANAYAQLGQQKPAYVVDVWSIVGPLFLLVPVWVSGFFWGNAKRR